MFEDTDNRGQVGIGTLIVFIAMVLVAAIAAGVLVNTAGFLQESAEQTGQEAQGEVSDRVQVVSAYAMDASDSDGDYDTLNITIRKASGSDDINISDITFTYLGPTTTDSGNLDGITREAVSGNADYLRNESDRVELSIDVEGGDVGATDELQPGTEFRLQLTTSSGASTYIEGRIPETAETDGVVEV
ncbi:archaellin/type IV pilin N-terminal domain-containing protein [Salinigranum halophilum]|uniref:archaellin/type IV pilin N-terminal domain-containing protein n=1 Tax=Salinigranum halophilum TaxID=2565931 RepID=UPI0010A9373D|nr:archaellin/type IV pilin N-terminal domain-containing protein [Salinigranum halophilum]